MGIITLLGPVAAALRVSAGPPPATEFQYWGVEFGRNTGTATSLNRMRFIEWSLSHSSPSQAATSGMLGWINPPSNISGQTNVLTDNTSYLQWLRDSSFSARHILYANFGTPVEIQKIRFRTQISAYTPGTMRAVWSEDGVTWFGQPTEYNTDNFNTAAYELYPEQGDPF